MAGSTLKRFTSTTPTLGSGVARRTFRAFAAWLLVGWAGCATRAEIEHRAPSVPPATLSDATEPGPPHVVLARASSGSVPATQPATRSVEPRPLQLPRLFAALDRLEHGDHPESVRIAWFGDSHTAADFLTGEVRERLQSRFGNGGPGFVRIGVESGRHAQVATQRRGKWRQLPRVPTLYKQQDDGVFGVSGLAAHAISGRASLRQRRAAIGLSWEFVLRGAGPRPRALLRIDGSSEKIDLLARSTTRGSQLRGAVVSVPAPAAVELELRNVDVFGAFGTAESPGVELDTLGINGARIRTMLAWQEGAWLGELAQRDPVLVVLAFGTNESGDNVSVERYAADYAKVLELVRAALPLADCLLVGPTDRGKDQTFEAGRAQALDAMQGRFAAQSGCGYFSLWRHMGGAGGYSNWAKQSLAGSDGIHLTVDGYHRLGREFAEELLRAYDAWRSGGR